MKRKKLLYLFLIILSGCGKDGWLDVNSNWWIVPTVPVDLNYWQIHYENEKEDVLYEQFKYLGDFDSVHYEIKKEKGMDWLSLSKNKGIMKKGVSVGLTISLNKSLLREGKNSGTITYKIIDEKKEWNIPVTAHGEINIQRDKKNIDFGRSGINSSVTFRSLIGDRKIFITNLPSWLQVSANEIELKEYNNNDSNSVTLNFTCLRNQLQYGVTSNTINITSSGGLYQEIIEVTAEMIQDNDSIIRNGEYLFKIEKIYKSNKDVKMELRITNDKYRKTIKIDNNNSYASSTTTTFKVEGNDLPLESKETGTMIITIHDIPDNLESFTEISLYFKDININNPIVFYDVKL